MDNQSDQQHPPDLFDNFIQLKEASRGSRFMNWLIDNIFIVVALGYPVEYGLSKILLNTAPAFLDKAIENEGGLEYSVMVLSVNCISYLIYYMLSEAALKGLTLGKLLTGTRAIRLDAMPLTFKDALLRTLCRLIPFEVLSALGTKPWHDSLTNTTVIQVKR